jgi:hypothetical protein
MINSIIEAISVALNTEFGDRYDIHRERLEQGLEEPCFFIFCIHSTNQQFFGTRYLKTNQFCIQYFPESEEKRQECYAIAERMGQCLEHILVDGEDKPIRGTKMKHEVVDDILHFFVNYDLFVDKKKESVAMEEFSSGVQAKGW